MLFGLDASLIFLFFMSMLTKCLDCNIPPYLCIWTFLLFALSLMTLCHKPSSSRELQLLYGDYSIINPVLDQVYSAP